MRATLLLADHAVVADGKLYISGGQNGREQDSGHGNEEAKVHRRGGWSVSG